MASSSSRTPGPEGAAIERRKAEHLRIAAEEDVETTRAPGWDDVHLVHDALPATDAAKVDLSTRLLGHELALPLLIAGMTGGHSGAERVNATLADAAARHGLGMGVGSQRAALRDPSLRQTYAVVRDRAPHAFVIANVGISQLVAQDDGIPEHRLNLRLPVATEVFQGQLTFGSTVVVDRLLEAIHSRLPRDGGERAFDLLSVEG